MSSPALSHLLRRGEFPAVVEDAAYAERLRDLQLRMLRIQQGLFHQGGRAIVAFEGFDAAGKGGAIRRLTEKLDPRGFRVFPIGPPSPDEQRTHYLYRFWARLPHPKTLAIFDRTWYGRVLVERVEKLIPKQAWKRAYDEINEFERMLVDDGVQLIKIFLAISSDEQLERFESRIRDPYKGWKLTEADLEARGRWHEYVEAVDTMVRKTSTKRAPWHLVAANDKPHARLRVLEIVTEALDDHRRYIERAAKDHQRSLEREVAKLKKHQR